MATSWAVGSNLFNIFGILADTALITPIPLEGRIVDIDVWIMLIVAVALSTLIWTGHRISRAKGAALLGIYLAYAVWLYTTGI